MAVLLPGQANAEGNCPPLHVLLFDDASGSLESDEGVSSTIIRSADPASWSMQQGERDPLFVHGREHRIMFRNQLGHVHRASVLMHGRLLPVLGAFARGLVCGQPEQPNSPTL